MFRVRFDIFVLALVFSVGAVEGFSGSAKPENGDIVRTEYWVPREPLKAHYKIDCAFDLSEGCAEGKGIIRFRNATGRSMRRLAIQWTSLGTMQIKNNDKPVKVLAERKEGAQSCHRLIEVPTPIRPGEESNLEIKFRATAPELAGIEKVYMTFWYPRLWWGFETHDDYEVKVDISPEYTLGTSGVLDTKTGYYSAENVRCFGLYLGKGLKISEANAGDVLVRCVFTEKGEKCAKLLLETAVDVIDYYRNRFGFYPYSSLTIVPGSLEHPAGGHPIATNIVAIHGMEQFDVVPEVHWRWITAHEIGHQYWGEYVLSKDPDDSLDWLMIGLGIYADREYSRARKLGSEKHRGIMARYIEGVREGFDTTMGRTQEERAKVKFDFNNVVEHGKSYSAISALDCVLGKKVFDRIYKRCLKEFGGRRLGVHEFRTICEEESQQDLGWFFEQWVNSNRCLSYEISNKKCTKEGERHITEVEVKRLGDLKMPVPVTAYFEDGTSATKFTDRLLDINVLKFKSKAELKEVRLDPEGKLAVVVPPPPSLVERELIRKIRDLPWTGAGKAAFEIFEKAKGSKLSNVEDWFKLGLTLYDGEYYQEALAAFQRTRELAEEHSADNLSSVVWQGHILDLLGQRQEALKHYKKALKRPTGFGMRHDQYGIVISRQWIKERIKEPFKR